MPAPRIAPCKGIPTIDPAAYPIDPPKPDRVNVGNIDAEGGPTFAMSGKLPATLPMSAIVPVNLLSLAVIFAIAIGSTLPVFRSVASS